MAFFEDVYRTAAELAAENPIIPLGDIWIEKDTGRAKRGDGAKAWNDLPYWDPGGGGSGGGGGGDGDMDASVYDPTGVEGDAFDYRNFHDTPTLGSAAAADVEEFDPAGSASSAQSHAVQRANHTGTQAISTVTGLQGALDGKAPVGDLGGLKFERITQAAYDALDPPDADTIYFIQG